MTGRGRLIPAGAWVLVAALLVETVGCRGRIRETADGGPALGVLHFPRPPAPVPDFAASDLSVTPALAAEKNLLAGGRARVGFTVTNLGARATTVAVGIYVTSGAIVGHLDRHLATVMVPGLGEGDAHHSRVVVGLPGDLAPGHYTLGVIVDPDRSVTEADPYNDVAQVEVALVPPPCAPDAYEDDDGPDQASLLPLDRTQARNFCDDVVDWIAVQLTAGQPYVISGTGTNGTPNEAIVAPNGNTVAAGNLGADLHFTPTISGLWRIRLQSLGERPGPGWGYTVRVDGPMPKLPNLTAGEPYLFPPYPVRGGFVDLLSRVVNTGNAPAPPFFESWYLSADPTLDPGDRLIGTTEYLYSLAPGEGGIPHLLAIPPDVAPGRWYLIDVADPGNQIVETDEQDNVSPGAPFFVNLPSCAPDQYEEDDDAADATPITPGSSQVHNQCDDAEDFVAFDAPGPAGYLVRMVPGNAGVRTAIDVYGPTGRLLDTGCASAAPPGCWFQAPAAGRYAVDLGGDPDPDISGDYTVHLDRCDADAYEPDDYAGEAAPIAVGETQQHNACDPNWPDWQVFDATAGTTYTVTTAVLGPTIDTVVTLEDAAGNVLVTNDDAKPNSRYSKATWTATTTGKIYVDVEAKAGAGLDSKYTVTLQ